MKQLADDTNGGTLDRCAAVVMDVGLLVSRLVRAQSWRRQPAGLTTPQFRALTFVNAYPGSSPSDLAVYLMLTRPSISKLVDQLVRRRLVERRTDAADRRRSVLSLTAAGRRRLDAHFDAARALVAERLAPLPPAQRTAVTRAMELLRPCFAGPMPVPSALAKGSAAPAASPAAPPLAPRRRGTRTRHAP